MIAYASNTRTKRNLAQLRRFGWRVLLTPENWHGEAPAELPFAIDNGAWSYYQKNAPFDGEKFLRLVREHGVMADFIVIPDLVMQGNASLEFSLSWLGRLNGFPRLLLALQDGMTADDVGAVLRQHPKLGLFLGGSIDWKLSTMKAWGFVAHALGRYYHIGRVNSRRRIRMCQHSGAHSFDGTSATLYSVKVPTLDAETRQPSLLAAL